METLGLFYFPFRLNIFKQTKNEHIYTDKTNNNKQKKENGKKTYKNYIYIALKIVKTINYYLYFCGRTRSD